MRQESPDFSRGEEANFKTPCVNRDGLTELGRKAMEHYVASA